MAKKVNADTKATLLSAYAAVIEEARAEFEAEKAEQAAAWKKELARIKEEDLYVHNKEKRDREDALEINIKTRLTAITDREAKVFEREGAVERAEETLEELQAKVSSIPDLVAKAESTGFAKGKADAKKDFDAEVRLIHAENTAEKKVLEHALTSVKAVVSSQEQTIETLKAELASANARVSEIATNAVTAAGQSKVTVNAAQGK
ncbi:hypothetical protein SECTIM467_14 [Brevibacillus phage SecTim467]|uniref:Uncharacterized protein n=2 Tax=Jenstvirus jenst TaxID=1982225 RepID=A0A0K2CPL9_9CAUD|nr:hypothetical protein AVV11_gp177 [Brevibacillus phage Jenst]ALA07144.1 hypothetical protein JENST_14 [Brevibacillus phage Jenst]ALA07514.1 hypothetical protein SECTIM467_14 [Brevibacillus phage SecTim467]